MSVGARGASDARGPGATTAAACAWRGAMMRHAHARTHARARLVVSAFTSGTRARRGLSATAYNKHTTSVEQSQAPRTHTAQQSARAWCSRGAPQAAPRQSELHTLRWFYTHTQQAVHMYHLPACLRAPGAYRGRKARHTHCPSYSNSAATTGPAAVCCKAQKHGHGRHTHTHKAPAAAAAAVARVAAQAAAAHKRRLRCRCC
jgi:hypothetical protein